MKILLVFCVLNFIEFGLSNNDVTQETKAPQIQEIHSRVLELITAIQDSIKTIKDELYSWHDRANHDLELMHEKFKEIKENVEFVLSNHANCGGQLKKVLHQQIAIQFKTETCTEENTASIMNKLIEGLHYFDEELKSVVKFTKKVPISFYDRLTPLEENSYMQELSKLRDIHDARKNETILQIKHYLERIKICTQTFKRNSEHNLNLLKCKTKVIL